MRKVDPNIKLDTEMFENEAAFSGSGRLTKDAPRRGGSDGAGPLPGMRRQTACLPKTKTASFTVECRRGCRRRGRSCLRRDISRRSRGGVRGGVIPVGQRAASRATGRLRGLGAFLLDGIRTSASLSIFTPCVFPMIPITVSFFMNQRGGFMQAMVFSLGIIVLFCALGLGVTAAVGPFGVVQLGSNPWVNGFIAVVFGAFALSLLGAFEITLPSGMLTKLDTHRGAADIRARC